MQVMVRLIWVSVTIICCCVGFSCFIYCLKSRDMIFRQLDEARQRRREAEENIDGQGNRNQSRRQQEANMIMEIVLNGGGQQLDRRFRYAARQAY
jgi:hypothetical protein